VHLERRRTVWTDHPYGIYVCPTGPPSSAVAEAIEREAKKIDQLIAKLAKGRRC
jgi:hypothetical protein